MNYLQRNDKGILGSDEQKLADYFGAGQACKNCTEVRRIEKEEKVMSNEEWAKVQEGWHRKNLNKLYLKLKKGEPLDFTETERQYLCNALKWAGNEINYCYRDNWCWTTKQPFPPEIDKHMGYSCSAMPVIPNIFKLVTNDREDRYSGDNWIEFNGKRFVIGDLYELEQAYQALDLEINFLYFGNNDGIHT